MNRSCFICNASGAALKNCIAMISSDFQILPVSGGKLIDTLHEILDKKVEVADKEVFCKQCYKTCVVYDTLKSKLENTKHELSNTFERTQKLLRAKRVVVPASKLQPLPPDFKINLTTLANNLAIVNKEKKTEETTAKSKIEIEPAKTLEISNDTNDITKWAVSTFPNEIFCTTFDGENQEQQEAEIDNDLASETNEDVMEIDEECTTGVTTESKNENISINIENIKTEGIDSSELVMGDFQNMDADSYVLGKIKILNSEDEGKHTIVVDGENVSILEMMSGQKFVYENGEISFVMEDDDNRDNGDESNDDESQIELQVSGDEETANAIIAAAQEQGGAFIKVESGEMYRVQSVKSKQIDPCHNVINIVNKEGDKFRCLLCDKINENGNACVSKEFVSEADAMMKHLKTEHSATIYICQLCGLIMRKRNDYATHMAHHAKSVTAPNGVQLPKSKVNECDICKRTYNSKTLLQEHINTHTGNKPYQCEVCSKSFASKYTHQAHLKTHQARPRPFYCRKCGKSFLSQQNLNQHEKIHTGIKNFVCKICFKAFGTQHNLEVHGVVHSGEKQHECNTCGKCFARRAELVDHIRTHTGERPFSCDICSASFTQRSNLHSHRRATHFDDRRYGCDQCNKKFKRRRLLEYHIKASHTGERPLKCETCLATFVYPEHYKKHVKIHSGERMYSCEICGKTFNSRDNRNTHRFVHSDKKPYECLSCGASYMRKNLLIAHMTTSGHLAESIVVNQPRVTSVNDDNIKTTGQLKLLDNIKIVPDPVKLQEEVEAPKYIITTADIGDENCDNSYIQAISAEHLIENADNLAEANEGVLKLIQVKLPDGNDGWVALND